MERKFIVVSVISKYGCYF